jgi:hypothetical protein
MKHPDDPQVSEPFLDLGQLPPRPCDDSPPGLALMTARGPGARLRANRPSPLCEPADIDPDPARTSALGGYVTGHGDGGTFVLSVIVGNF